MGLKPPKYKTRLPQNLTYQVYQNPTLILGDTSQTIKKRHFPLIWGKISPWGSNPQKAQLEYPRVRFNQIVPIVKRSYTH